MTDQDHFISGFASGVLTTIIFISILFWVAGIFA